MHDQQQWTAVYVGSLAARMTTTETATVGNGDALDVVGKILWRQAVQASIGEHSKLEINAFRSQCRSRSIGVTCSYREDRCISLVAALRTD